jgi:hypothetical protein
VIEGRAQISIHRRFAEAQAEADRLNSESRDKGGRPAVGPAITVRLPERTIAWMDALARERGVTRAHIFRTCTTAYQRAVGYEPSEHNGNAPSQRR